MRDKILVLTVCLLPCNFCLAACPSADLTGDCFVDFSDFALLAVDWPATDFNNVAAMSNQWLTEGVPNDPCNLVWVYIDDPGVPGHEGFTGYMSKYETTNAQYAEYLNSAMEDGAIKVYTNVVYASDDSSHSEPYFDTRDASQYSQIAYSGGVFSVRSRSMSDHPVVKVSWYGAMAFCDYYGYRLPTEWEWQAVADFDGSYTYGCGTTIDQSKANYGFANPLGLFVRPYTSPVDYYPSYGYGMNDMAGNVFEWTSSLWNPSYPSYRVLRGGSCGDGDSDHCKVSYRNTITAYSTFPGLSFRVCR